MAVIEKEAAAIREEHRRSPMGWVLGALGILAVAALVVSAVVLARAPEPLVPAGGSVAEPRPGSLYTEQEQTVLRLVARGYIPAETLNGEPFRTKRLVNEGLVPMEALNALPVDPSARYPMRGAPRHETRQELIRGLVNEGLIPRATMP